MSFFVTAPGLLALFAIFVATGVLTICLLDVYTEREPGARFAFATGRLTPHGWWLLVFQLLNLLFVASSVGLAVGLSWRFYKAVFS